MPKYILVDDAIKTTWMVLRGLGYHEWTNEELVDTVEKVFATAPSVEEPVHEGIWRDVYMSSPSSFAGTCSVCGSSNDIPPPADARYCPSCGARMTYYKRRKHDG